MPIIKKNLFRFKNSIWLCVILAVLTAWRHQPYRGVSFCPLKGFMRDFDFVEEVRPTIKSIILRSINDNKQRKNLSPDFDEDKVISKLDLAIDDLRECVRTRGLEYCRYIGPDEQGRVIMGRTIEGPNAIKREDEHLYRYIIKNIPYEFLIIPNDYGPNEFGFEIFHDPAYQGGAEICNLGCMCNPQYGVR